MFDINQIFVYIIASLFFSEMRDKMRKWREENSRNSEQIVEVGEELISEYASKLGDDSKFLNLLCSCSAHVSFTV